MFSSSFSRFFVLALCAVPALTAGTPSPVPVPPTRVRRAPDTAAFNPTDLVPRSLAPADAALAHLTNAQRFARGLPPRSPRLNVPRRRRGALAARQSPTPCALSQATGTIQVNGAPAAAAGSYVAGANAFGEYTLGNDAAAALEVVLLRCDSNTEPFDIRSGANGIAAYPFVGAVSGFANTNDDLGPGSFNYAYIAGTSQVAPGPAQRAPNAFSASTGAQNDAESAIWTLGPDNALTPTWVNTDGAEVAAGTVVYVASEDAFALTGDVGAFEATFGTAIPVTFTFVENA
ncbi:hypothetical protein C8Q79DRAFT_928637 [Trametes meyenii]|nr:hypothetical protein C8Q79DRAFT_928637 [Trametes meyenii]